MDAHGRGEHRDIARQRLERGEPEPLACGRDEHGVGGVDVQRDLRGLDLTEGEQGNCARDRPRTVVALLQPARVGREQQVGAVRVEPERRSRLGASDRAKATDVDADWEHGAPAPDRPARDLIGERLRHRRDEVEERQRRERDLARTGMREVRAVECHGPDLAPRCQRRPRGQAEVGMDDVESVVAVAPDQVGRRPRVGAAASGREREHLDVDPVNSTQRLDLIADEAAERRPRRGRVHVRDDQRAHRGRGERSGGAASIAGGAAGVPGGAASIAGGAAGVPGGRGEHCGRRGGRPGGRGERGGLRLWHHPPACPHSLTSRSGCSTPASAG